MKCSICEERAAVSVVHKNMVVFMSLILICPDDENEGLSYQRQTEISSTSLETEGFQKEKSGQRNLSTCTDHISQDSGGKKLNELQEAMAIHKHKNKIETEQVYLHGPNSVDMDLSSICHKRPKTVGSLSRDAIKGHPGSRS